jgi:metal-dependent amidase/aminoacylase/carboxypeptidase family protein
LTRQAEESGGGKIHLINAGFYKDVDISLMSHPMTQDGVFIPTLAITEFAAEFFGKSAHAVHLISLGVELIEGCCAMGGDKCS